jgi:hypothetical protein
MKEAINCGAVYSELLKNVKGHDQGCTVACVVQCDVVPHTAVQTIWHIDVRVVVHHDNKKVVNGVQLCAANSAFGAIAMRVQWRSNAR